MAVNQLSDEPEAIFCDLLRSNWDPTNTLGFDPTQSDPDKADFLPIQTSLAEVGYVYPSVVVTFSNQTTSGSSGFTFMGANGPGRAPDGQCLATIRAEATGDGYTGDSNTYSAIDADELVRDLRQEVERICRANPLGGSTDFTNVGARRAGDIPDDDDAETGDIVRQAQETLLYRFIQKPA